ncbi:SusC/RagA family TonB-linked outer membrane protein [Runella sp. MFBS21]|uniref:SusC/RagA family TonB-linked outer membrane protein n=1 Tax=Runella sp. MFBS21 TaxID=3034018 RepID=UPI0023F8315B|nr:SusC/RagA family TonB-linked outer membrane protein [Runella sp. MFBS21]MDF7817212.1 SusC/RagA family TonB-linked outer membrane protein [Runella sp. MFBS21]
MHSFLPQKRWRNPWVSVFLLAFLLSTTILAQEVTLQGTITDADNNTPLPGVSIVVKGTNQGTNTDANGKYRINTSSSATLVFSFVGYSAQEVAVGNRTTIDLKMSQDLKQLQEVVVTALGIQKEKKTLAFATQSVKGSDLIKAREPNPINSLVGKVAGLNVGASAELLRAPQVSLRGGAPLYVVDGIPINSDTWNISPDDIESMDVLKGPSGTALYGFRAQNGVIMITTKKGSKDKRGFSVDVNSSTMFDKGFIAIPKVQDQYGPGDHGKYAFVDGRGGGVNDGDYDIWGPPLDGRLLPQYDSPIDPATGKRIPTPWLPRGKDNLTRFIQTGILSNNNVSVAASNDKADIRVSLSHQYQRGVIPNTQLNITNLNTSLGYNFSNKLRFESTVNYSRQYTPNIPDVDYGPNSLIYNSIIWGGADWNVDDMKQLWQPGKEGIQQIYAEYQRYNNPWFVVKEWLRGHYKNDIYAYALGKYKINDFLNAQLRTQVTTYDILRTEKMPYSATSYGREEARGDYREDRRNLWENNTDLLINFDKEIVKNITLKASVGGSMRLFRYTSNFASTDYLNVPGVYSFSNSRNPVQAYNFQSYMRVMSGYYAADLSLSKYANISLTGRWDKTSTLPSGRNVGFYPSVGVTSVISDYVKLPDAITFLKVRASFARVKEAFTQANIGVPPGAPVYYGANYNSSYDGPSYGTTVAYNISRPYNNEAAAYYSSSLIDPNIQPSSRTNYEGGVEMKFLNNRLGLDVTYFSYLDGPRIFGLTLPESTGYGSLTTNGIKSQRKGLEIAVSGNVIKNANGFNWDVLANWSTWQETLREIYGNQTRLNQFYKIGDRLDAYYGTAFVRTQDGQIVNDASGRPIYNPVSQFLGYTNPDWTFGFQNKFSYKNFNFSFQFDGRIGGVIENYIQKQTFRGGRHIATVQGDMGVARLADTEGRKTWVGPGVVLTGGTISYDPDGKILNYGELKFTPMSTTYATYLQDWISRYYNSTEGNIMNRTFVKLREVQVGYSLPAGLLGKNIRQATISLVGRNLLYFAHSKDLDVEQFVNYSNRSSSLQTPTLRRYGININFTF